MESKELSPAMDSMVVSTSHQHSIHSTSPYSARTLGFLPDMDSTAISTRQQCGTNSHSQCPAKTSSSPPELACGSVSTMSDDDEPYLDSDASFDVPLIQPKIEELDDDVSQVYDLDEAKPAPRKRGRPRKDSKKSSVEPKKASHARSKTGCGTCRRRKKKCDEAKPGCSNCKKNHVICDGYEPLQPWQSGKQKALTVAQPRICVEIQPLFTGIDCDVDQFIFVYFLSDMGKVLSLTDSYNPFQKIIIPMAYQDVGVMHSVLYLSGSCLNASQTHPEYQKREDYHSAKAMSLLRQGLNQSLSLSANDQSTLPNGDSTITQSLVLFLQTICAGAISGEYRHHLKGMKHMLTDGNFSFSNQELRQFVLEFILYHDYCAAITSEHNPIDDASRTLMDFKLPQYMIPPAEGTLLGVLDGIFAVLYRIRCLRDLVRCQRKQGHKWHSTPVVEEGFRIDRSLRNWVNSYDEDSAPSRYICSQLYRLCTFIYLQRTMEPSLPHQSFEKAVDQGIRYIGDLANGPGPNEKKDKKDMRSILLMPLFLLGCAAFEPRQRPPISAAFDKLQEWSKLANIQCARVIVEDMWLMMDAGLESETWDWEAIIAGRGWDFLAT